MQGEEGVLAAVRTIATELRHAMAQAGAPSLDALRPSMLCRVETPHLPLRLHWIEDDDDAVADANAVSGSGGKARL